MRIAATEQQHGLEEAHRDRPHGGRAAEPGQHHFREYRLHREQQECGEEERGREDPEGVRCQTPTNSAGKRLPDPVA